MKGLYLALLCAVPLGAMNKQESKYEKYCALAGITAGSAAIASIPTTTSIIKGSFSTIGWPLTAAIVGGCMATDYVITHYMSQDCTITIPAQGSK